MKKTKHLPAFFALIVLALLVVFFPPGQFTWHTFLRDHSTLGRKLEFLAGVYALPAAFAFASVVLFQLQMRISMLGLSGAAIFPVSLLASAFMMGAFRSMVSGVGGVPGYALGVAAAYTMMSRIYAIRASERTLLGRPLLKIIWRGDQEAIAMIAARRPLVPATAPR